MHLLNTHFRCIAIQAPTSSAEQALQNIFVCMKNALNLNSFQSHRLLSDISEHKQVWPHFNVKMPKPWMLSHAEQQTGNRTDPTHPSPVRKLVLFTEGRSFKYCFLAQIITAQLERKVPLIYTGKKELEKNTQNDSVFQKKLERATKKKTKPELCRWPWKKWFPYYPKAEYCSAQHTSKYNIQRGFNSKPIAVSDKQKYYILPWKSLLHYLKFLPIFSIFYYTFFN